MTTEAQPKAGETEMNMNTQTYIVITDVNGDKVLVSPHELTRANAENCCTIFGMSLPTVAQLKCEYTNRKGPLPMTPESVKEIFAA